ncbi:MULTISPECIES: hypothetical protein [unclassified Methylobacterium]|jgi:hypothetical protein|uniref:hypothetical protein n=1 Tax=unclassified Methylobacterium TaxID=2615210 RepID=UPI0013562786|nr:hypothetical protein [Methylobacterium sp. 2A]MWV25026.1 hypothetical protein [Methylobacterium sp. 2A]
MVEAVNRIAPAVVAQRQTSAVRTPESGTRVARTENRTSFDAASEILRRAKRAETESLLASMASAPPGADRMAAHILQEAERKLVRLKAEARAAAASGDRRAARAIARDLAVLARQIADAAQDYAVAQARPDVVSPALAKAAARMNAAAAPPEAGGAIDAGAMVGEAAAAATEVAEVAAAPEERDTARPDFNTIDGENGQVQQPADQGFAPLPLPPSGGSGGAPEEGILVKAHRLFEDAVDLLRAMEALASRRSFWAGRIGLAAPTVLPVWPVAVASAGAGQPVVSAPPSVVAHGR